MKPAFANLVKAKNGKLTVTVDLLKRSGGGEGLGESRLLRSADGSRPVAEARPRAGRPPGMWVHYLETRASYGISLGGETWSASGPFSGCQIVVGKKGGHIYVAHLAHSGYLTASCPGSALLGDLR